MEEEEENESRKESNPRREENPKDEEEKEKDPNDANPKEETEGWIVQIFLPNPRIVRKTSVEAQCPDIFFVFQCHKYREGELSAAWLIYLRQTRLTTAPSCSFHAAEKSSAAFQIIDSVE